MILCQNVLERQFDPDQTALLMVSSGSILFVQAGVVGWCEGVMYHASLGLPADIGLQLGKACYPCSR